MEEEESVDRVVRNPSRLRKLVIVVSFLERLLALGVALVLGLILYVSLHSSRTADLVVDCTTPGHQCYDQLQRNSTRAIQQLEDVIVASNICSAKHYSASIRDIERCITVKLAQYARAGAPHRTGQ